MWNLVSETGIKSDSYKDNNDIQNLIKLNTELAN
jgi:hypothetical protein